MVCRLGCALYVVRSRWCTYVKQAMRRNTHCAIHVVQSVRCTVHGAIHVAQYLYTYVCVCACVWGAIYVKRHVLWNTYGAAYAVDYGQCNRCDAIDGAESRSCKTCCATHAVHVTL
eukprot:6094629-Pyramimonas_sp.AAC.1